MKANIPDISIIVPVYNAEKYIHRCIDSLLAQTFSNFELLLIDDGSPDNSGAICDEYAKKDDRIKVFHKENCGVASARQFGIDKACGEYTIHADPDDWAEPDMLTELYKKAKESDADIVICDFFVDTEKGCIYRPQEVSADTPQEVLNALLFHKLHGSLWNKLIKATCYTELNVRFTKNLNYCEDYLVCIKMFMNDIKTTYLQKAFYHYDQIVNNESITRKYTIKTYEQRCQFVKELQKVLDNKHNDGILKNEAGVAIECLQNKVLTRTEYKDTYSPRKWELIKYINGYTQKIKFLIATIL